MTEYKAGDKIRIVSKKAGKYWESNGKMDRYLGKIMTIQRFDYYGKYYVMQDDYGFWHWYPWMIEGLAQEQKCIVIGYGESEPTVAKLFVDGKIQRKAVAKCSPDDEYDEKVGIDLAISRLLEPPKKRCFSLAKYIKSMVENVMDYKNIAFVISGWAASMDGKTVEECEAKGYWINENWVEER